MEPPFLLPQEDGKQTKQPARARCWPALHTKAQRARKLDGTALNTPANTKKMNSSSTTGDHHAEHDTRRRTVHRRKHRGSN